MKWTPAIRVYAQQQNRVTCVFVVFDIWKPLSQSCIKDLVRFGFMPVCFICRSKSTGKCNPWRQLYFFFLKLNSKLNTMLNHIYSMWGVSSSSLANLLIKEPLPDSTVRSGLSLQSILQLSYKTWTHSSLHSTKEEALWWVLCLYAA